MIKDKTFQNAKAIANKLTYNDILPDLAAFNKAMMVFGSSPLIEELHRNELGYKYKPSKAFLFLIYFLKVKYSNVEICLGRFYKIFEIMNGNDCKIMEQKVFINVVSLIFVEQFERKTIDINTYRG